MNQREIRIRAYNVIWMVLDSASRQLESFADNEDDELKVRKIIHEQAQIFFERHARLKERDDNKQSEQQVSSAD